MAILEKAGLDAACPGVPNQSDFTHFNAQGRARMVNVGDKAPSHRTATAGARVLVSRETFALIQSGGMKKGDVLTVAQIAGVMGAKRTPELIPMCHPLLTQNCTVNFALEEKPSPRVIARCTVKLEGKTGVEMEALTGISVALLTVYDMCKALDKRMIMTDVHLEEKTGGKSGEFHF